MTTTETFDLVIIGAGPAGYTAAIRAAQLGMKVACIEKRPTLGGTCLNVGCIPSKSLLDFSYKYYDAKTNFQNIGITVNPKLDLKVMLSKKNQILNELCKGLEMLFAKNKITKIIGNAIIASSNTVNITNGKNIQTLEAKNILIATGSEVSSLPGIDIDEKIIVSSTGALDLQEVPNKMAVIGAGFIGLELGSVWARLGSEVTVIEYDSKIVPILDEEIGNQFTKILQKQGLQFKLNTKVVKCEQDGKQAHITLQNGEVLTFDVVLVAVGRKPFTSGLGLENIGIPLNNKGQIEVNKHFQTNIPNIYAIGDVIAGPMLAHKAEEEAIAAVEIMAGLAGHVNYNIIPSIIYTHPEVAFVGLTEQELKKANISYNIGKFPFLANSRAKAVLDTEGMVKILADSKTDKILGAHIIGPDAGTLIAEIAVAMEFSASSEDIARTCHAHPTLNEAVKEAALAVAKRTINL